jgi:apolipoprotein N-acyltransferase
MNRAAVVAHAQQFRRAGVDPPPAGEPWLRQWYGKLALLLGGAGLLTAAFAPVGAWPLAWFGLVPWLLVLWRCRSVWSALGWSWLAGTLFFIANMWWMAAVTVPGMIGLMAILGIYWGYAGMILHGAGVGRATVADPATPAPRHPLASPTLQVVLTAATWTAAAEWFRGTWPWHGLPWLYLGYTQSPVLTVCQSADLFGVAGLSFLIAATNAWLALWLRNRLSLRGLVPAGLMVLVLIAGNVGYGIYRLRTEPARLTPGPLVVVVQPNYPQSNSGAKGAEPDQMVDDHLSQTQGMLGSHPGVDLVVWSETIMPPLNSYARRYLADRQYGAFLRDTFERLNELTYRHRVALLTGGEAVTSFVERPNGDLRFGHRSNVVFAFSRTGAMEETTYSKIHLVPFGEFIPFKQGCPPLYRLALKLGPPDMADYELIPGDENDLPVFELKHDPQGPTADAPPWRYVTPICFEDIDPDLCARMLRPEAATPFRKRADFLVNVTNDGWFMANENAQHLQAAVFRSIENRVSTARSVNTGISGFIDPLGRATGLVAARTTGASVGRLEVDGRVTLFTRTGQTFAQGCAALAVLTALTSLTSWGVRRARRPS